MQVREDKFTIKKGEIQVVNTAEEAEKIAEENNKLIEEAMRKAGLL